MTYVSKNVNIKDINKINTILNEKRFLHRRIK